MTTNGNGSPGPGETQKIEFDPDLENFLPLIEKNPPVSLRDTQKYFSPQAVRYLSNQGVLPYLFDVDRGEVTFAVDRSKYTAMTPEEFKISFYEFFNIVSPEIKRKLNDNSRLKFVLLDSPLLDKLRPYVESPERITAYNSQRQEEEKISRGAINNQEANAFVDDTISRAIRQRASDIHFEYGAAGKFRIRFRVDGSLRVIPNELDANTYRAVITILKNRCGAGVKLDEKRRPQDGKLVFNSPDVNSEGHSQVYDLRAAFRPVVSEESTGKTNGSSREENAILRIAQRGVFKTLDQLGLSEYDHERIGRACAEPNGILLVTGPTGSGKTTTLYGMLSSINTTDRKIVTIEDPVEVQIPGMQQTQVHNDIGVDFASFLRGALRTDPDVIFVGEIRDKETADTALEASMTGHLVMSSLHTNNAPGAVNRLINMKVSKLDLATNLRGVLAQTLVPIFEKGLQERLMSGKLTDEDLKHITYSSGDELLNNLMGEQHYPGNSFYFFEGDEICFKDRAPLTEFWLLDEKSQDAICNPEEGVSLLTRAAENSGMRPLFISGIEKVIARTTSLNYVLGEVGESIFREKKELLIRYINSKS